MKVPKSFSEYFAKYEPDATDNGAPIRRYEPTIRRIGMFIGLAIGLGVDEQLGGGVVVVMYFFVLGTIISEKICYQIKWLTFAILVSLSTVIACGFLVLQKA